MLGMGHLVLQVNTQENTISRLLYDATLIISTILQHCHIIREDKLEIRFLLFLEALVEGYESFLASPNTETRQPTIPEDRKSDEEIILGLSSTGISGPSIKSDRCAEERPESQRERKKKATISQ